MPLSTGVLKVFALELYSNGFLIRFPNPEKPDELLPFEDPKKISGVFMEHSMRSKFRLPFSSNGVLSRFIK